MLVASTPLALVIVSHSATTAPPSQEKNQHKYMYMYSISASCPVLNVPACVRFGLKIFLGFNEPPPPQHLSIEDRHIDLDSGVKPNGYTLKP